MNLNRRHFLQAGAGATVAALGSSYLADIGRAAGAAKIPLALQIYSVRQTAAKDLPGVLKAVAKMGYQGVEFAGYYGWEAKEIRKMLDDNGIQAIGTHTQLNTLLGDAFQETVEYNKTLGNPNLIVPAGMKQAFESIGGIKMAAALFNELADKAEAVDMHVGYHAHGYDFQKIDGQTAWNRFFSLTEPEVIMQLDIGNCLGGGGDPYATLEKFPGRSKLVHLKEHGGPQGAVIGEGDVDWDRVFELCKTVGDTEWYIVEQERYPEGDDPMAAVRACIENIKKMRS